MVEKKDSFNEELDDDDVMSSSYTSDDTESAALLPTAATATPPPPPPVTLTATESVTPEDIMRADEGTLPPPYAQVVSTSGQGSEVQSDNDDDDEDARRRNHERVKCGAGVASGLFGMLMGGPVLAILLGFGTAYAADQPGAAGDVARSVGEVALVAQAKFRKLDDQHKFVENGKVMAAKAVQKMQEADREHRIVDRIKDVAIRSFRSVAQFVKEHRILERGTQAVGQAAYWAANKIADKVRSHQQQQQQQQQGSRAGSSTTAQYRAVRSSDTLDDNSKKRLGK
jgi:hypothetical protein